jgi:hypothetical protein
MQLIILLIVIATTIWVAFDAKKNQITTHDKPYSINTGALAWFFCCLLLWIAAFPYYLVRRNKLLKLRRASASPPALENTSTLFHSASKKQATFAATVSPLDYDQQLRQLAKLKDDGIISAADFEQKKKVMLAAISPTPSPVEALPSVALASSNQVSHALVWVSAFVPLLAILIDGILAAMELNQWLGVPIVIGINILLLTIDEKRLKAQGLPTTELGSAWLVPVYLFKRVRVAGGGYGYAICWMITFSISVLL